MNKFQHVQLLANENENKTQHLLQEKLRTQEMEISRQAAIISQQELETIRQGEVISRLEEALSSSDRKCETEVLETGQSYICLNLLNKNLSSED